MRHSENVPALLRAMRSYIYDIKELESNALNAGRHAMEMGARVPCNEKMRKIYWWCDAPEIARKQREKAQSELERYRAGNTRSAADWLRYANIMCMWTMANEGKFGTEFKRMRFAMLWDACTESSPRYKGDNLDEATTFRPHYSRIARFFSLREIVRTWGGG